MFADCIANAGLAGAANNVMSIFLLKNGYGYSDRVEIEPIVDRKPVQATTIEDIAKRYGFYDEIEAEGQEDHVV